MFSQENFALAERLADFPPSPRMREHYRDFFNPRPPTDKILMELLNLVGMHVAMFGYGGYADNEPEDKWDKEFPHDDPMLGRWFGDLDAHSDVEEVDWGMRNLLYQMLVCIFRLESKERRESCVYTMWKQLIGEIA